MIYLDYSANTPADKAVLETFVITESNYPGNPNSSHPAGVSAKEKLAELTDSIAGILNVLPTEIIYTSGASEANNLAIKGIAAARSGCGKHIITTPLEHASVSEPIEWLKSRGFETETVDIGSDGRVDLEHLRKIIRNDTVLVAVTAVDSELGTVQPIGEISKIVHSFPNAYLHVDFTQAVGKIPVSFDGIDTASFAPHKFYGLNGSGVMFKRKDAEIEPLIHGGSAASVYRSGTPTLALEAALEKALDLATGELEKRQEKVRNLNSMLRKALGEIPEIRINSPEDAIPHILNVSAAGIKGTRMQRLLAEQGVCVSVKSACSSDGNPSKAVLAVSNDRRNALSSWRISLSHLTTEDEMKEFLTILDDCIKKQQR